MLFLAVSIQANTTDEDKKCIDLLEHSQIYIDNSNSLEIEDILKEKVEFKNNNKKTSWLWVFTRFQCLD